MVTIYLLIEIDYPDVPLVYVSVRNGKPDRVEDHDFLNMFNRLFS